jgi:hypothetical protein
MNYEQQLDDFHGAEEALAKAGIPASAFYSITCCVAILSSALHMATD